MPGPQRAHLLLCVLFALGCARERELREWSPEDHQPPPGGGSDSRSSPEEDPDPEATLFRSRCASCHGTDGTGHGPAAPPNVPDFTLASFQSERSDADLTAVITTGRGLMPGFGEELTEPGIAAMVRYVRRLGAAAAPEPVPAPVPGDPAVPDPAVPDPAVPDPAVPDPAVPDPAVPEEGP